MSQQDCKSTNSLLLSLIFVGAGKEIPFKRYQHTMLSLDSRRVVLCL